METYDITIFRNGKETVVRGKVGNSLLRVLTDHGVFCPAPCGGRGRCGKCGVRMCLGATEPGEADRCFFDEDQLRRGLRLACASYPQSDCAVVPDAPDEEGFESVSGFRREETDDDAMLQKGDGCTDREEAFDIAVDIGTTTIAIALVELPGGRVLHTTALPNRQSAYGADVISRIRSANEGKRRALTEIIREDLCVGMERLIGGEDMPFSRIREIAVAGNTTMGHLLLGYPCETLGVYPYKPVNIGTVRVSSEDLFHLPGAAVPVTILPGISAYVGADIAAGLLACGFECSDRVNVLIDLGTNGEMAVGNREKILVTSAAAGPAFEGGNISCGMGSVPGAISRVEIVRGEAICETIGGKEPLGLCGTGVIETVYELRGASLLDETGLLAEACPRDGFVLARTPGGRVVSFSQGDVREVQLAKAAIRAGLEILLSRYGVTCGDIGHVYLAGGLGCRLDPEKAAGIGLLPEELADRTVAVGNASLGGGVAFLAAEGAAKRMDGIIRVSEEIQLAADSDFNQLYIGHMHL